MKRTGLQKARGVLPCLLCSSSVLLGSSGNFERFGFSQTAQESELLEPSSKGSATRDPKEEFPKTVGDAHILFKAAGHPTKCCPKLIMQIAQSFAGNKLFSLVAGSPS